MEAAGAGGGAGFSIIALFIALVSLVALVVWLKKAKAKHIEALKDKFTGKTILVQSSANFFGQKSKGSRQSRGNGTLVMTDEELYFSLMIPANELSIPLNSIKGITTGKSFLGKSKFRPLLIVEYMVDDELDSAAWLVGDLFNWTDQINEHINENA